jgi:hypothetical protein
MGALEGQPILTGQKWEEVEKGGNPAIKKWINDQMQGKSCLVVLVGTLTSTRPWVDYEIKKAWSEKRGVVGIRIHGLKDLRTQKTAVKGSSPFANLNLNGTPFGNIVTLYDPPSQDSKAVFASISNSIERLVEDAIKIRAKYS